MSAMSPAASSSTKQKERVWVPSPYTVSGRPSIACTRKFDTTRPSSGFMRGPIVLKMRAIFTSTSW